MTGLVRLAKSLTPVSSAPLLGALAFSLFFSIAWCRQTTEAGQRPDPQEILKAAAENGRRAAGAVRDYSYSQELSVEAISPADTVTGRYYRFSQVSFDQGGSRLERSVEERSTLPKEIHLGTQTLNNLIRNYDILLTPDLVDRYEFNYVGREKIDELSAYVFDLHPASEALASARHFRGRIWIDDQDMQVVKVAGEVRTGEQSRQASRFETYFQNHDDYWLPAYVSAEDYLRVDKRTIRVMVKVRSTSFKKVK